MHADDILRPLRETRNPVQIERRCIRCQDSALPHHVIEFLEYSLLHAHVFEYCFDHDIGLRNIVTGQTATDKADALRHVFRRQLALLQRAFIILADGRQAFIECFLPRVEDRDRDTGIRKIHCNARAHGAGANHRCSLDRARCRTFRHVRNLACRALAKKRMAQCFRFRGLHQLHKQIAFVLNAVIECFRHGSAHGIDAFQRRRERASHCLDGIARGLQECFMVRIIDCDIAYFRQRTHIGNPVCEGDGALLQITLDHFIEQSGCCQLF